MSTSSNRSTGTLLSSLPQMAFPVCQRDCITFAKAMDKPVLCVASDRNGEAPRRWLDKNQCQVWLKSENT